MKKYLLKLNVDDYTIGFLIQLTRIMRFSMLFLFLGFINVFATESYSQNATLSLDMNDVSVEEVLKTIENQSEFYFLYNHQLVDVIRKVNINVTNVNIKDLLGQLFAGTNVGYMIMGRQIVLTQKKMLKEDLSGSNGLQKAYEVTGKVTDEKGNPLPGVNIMIKGTTQGTVTDTDGDFVITVPDQNAVLIFSFIGYKSTEIVVGNNKSLNIQLQEDLLNLDEVVVTGYTAQSKRFITGSVGSYDVKTIKTTPVISIDQALQGRVPGVLVSDANGPGGDVMVRIRGFGTIGNSEPLFVIDGVPTMGNLKNIDPNDIESVQVLKDASSASIYGARAANGVIVITTKNGKPNQQLKVSFNAWAGTESFTNFPETPSPMQLAELTFQDMRLNGITSHKQYGDLNTGPRLPTYIIPEGSENADLSTYDLYSNPITRANKEGTDWFDEIFDPALMMNYSLNLSGGKEKSQYNVSLGYLDHNGTLIETSYNRYSIRVNTLFEPDKWIRIGENFTASYSERIGINRDGSGLASNWSQAYRTNPLIPVYDVMGNYAGSHAGSIGLGASFTPYPYLERNKHNKQMSDRLFGNLFLELEPLKGLTFKTSIGVDYEMLYGIDFFPKDPERRGTGASNHLTEVSMWNSQYNWTNTLTYENVFNDIHRLSVLFGTEAIQNVGRGFNATRNDYFSEDVSFRYLIASGGAQSNTGLIPTRSTLFSLFGKIDYAFKDKYLVNFTLRNDKSSRFTEDNRSAIFPAVGAGWLVSEEGFLKNSTIISTLKLRAGWGQTGNQIIDDFGFADQFAPNPFFNSYDLTGANSSIITGFAKAVSGNPNRKWETNTSLNVGFDAGFFNNKLSLSFDWFNRQTTNLLIRAARPATAGSSLPPFINIGGMENKGFELVLGYEGSTPSDFTYGANISFSSYKNEVTKISDNDDSFLTGSDLFDRGHIATRTQKGHPISSFYGWIVDGIIQEGPDAGNFKYRDIDGDGTITDLDRTFIGSPHPNFTCGVDIHLGFKNLDFGMFLYGVQGNKIYNFMRWFTDFNNFGDENRNVRVLDSWTPENHSNSLAQYNSATAGANSRPSSYFVEDGSYLRFQDIHLGYTFKKIHRIEGLRLYVQLQNYITITKYSGIDPDLTFNNFTDPYRNLEYGVDQGQYPTPKSFIVGLNLNF